FAEFRLDCRIGFAPTPALALLGARSARPVNVFFEPDQFIPSLPIEALEPPVEIFEILALWGIRTAGRFLALGREAIAGRPRRSALSISWCRWPSLLNAWISNTRSKPPNPCCLSCGVSPNNSQNESAPRSVWLAKWS